MQELLRQTTARLVNQLFGLQVEVASVTINETPAEFIGDFTVVIFPFVKAARKSPDETGKLLGEALQNELADIESFNVVKGFLNIQFTASSWMKEFDSAFHQQNFFLLPATGKKIMVEYCAPNTNKPIHLGHVRNILIGYSVGEILKAAGNEVVKVNMINDRGVHICKSMLAYQRFGSNETPESTSTKGDHFVGNYYVRFETELKKQIAEGIAKGLNEEDAKKQSPLMKEIQVMLQQWENGDEEVRKLWSMMNGWVYEGFESTFKKIGNDFQHVYLESQTYLRGKQVVEEGLKQKVFFQKPDGSVWIDLTSEGLDEKLVLRADGTSVYITQDLGTAEMKFEDYHCDESIYVVANEQDYHFKVLKLICQKLNRPFANGIFHLNYGMVDLPTGKMKSREGTVVDADDLIAEMEREAEQHTREQGKIDGFTDSELKNLFHQLGMGALKFFILKVDPKKRMIFNTQESIDFHGFTGPFIQYTHARICSVLRKATDEKIIASTSFNNYQLHADEKKLMVQLLQYPAVIKEAASKLEPYLLAHYLFHLAKNFNQFYASLSIMKADSIEEKSFRLSLSEQVKRTLDAGMKLLGIEVPERM